MTPVALRRWCLHFDDALETFPFEPGVSVFRNSRTNKVFAITTLTATPLDVTIKADPDEAEALRATHDSIVPGYHNNKRHWITVTFGGDADDALVKSLISDSYSLVSPNA
jgi:predicted DNA-binding protein (MmcQ/YjbR family)